MKPNPEKLTCISIIVCDDVYRDELTKKMVVVGTFNAIVAPKFPAHHPRLDVLFTLTNGLGDYDLSLRVEHERSGRKIAELRGPLTLDDPLRIHDIRVTLANLTFPEAGKYWVVLESDGEILQQRPLHLIVPTAKPEKGSHD